MSSTLLVALAGAVAVAFVPAPGAADGATPGALGARRTPPGRVAGVTFVWTMRSSSADKARRQAVNTVAQVRVAGDKVRLDYREGAAMVGAPGDGYVVMDASAGSFSIVSAKDRRVMVMDAKTFGSGMGMVLNNPMMKVTVSDVAFSYSPLGPGEPILGYATRRVRTRSGSTVEVKIMGRTMSRTTSSDSAEHWIARLDGVDAAGFAAWGKAFGGAARGLTAELEAKMEPYLREYAQGGVALRTVTWSTATDAKGKVVQDSVTIEVTELTKGDLDPAIYAIPSGYEVVNLGDALKGAAAAMDSASASRGEAKEEAKKPGAADLVKSGLGGLIRRKPPA